MSRTIHIAITDAARPGTVAGTTRRGGSRAGRTVAWHDPDPDDLVIPPDDPDPDDLVIPPDDPDPDDLVIPPDDPRYRIAVPLAAVATGAVPGCACGGPAGGAGSAAATAALPGAVRADTSGFVIVRLADDHDGGFSHLVALARARNLDGLLAALEIDRDDEKDGEGDTEAVGVDDAGGYLPSRPLIRDLDRDGYAGGPTVRSTLRQLEQRAVGGWPRPGPSLLRYWRIDCRQHPDRVAGLLAELRALAAIDIAYRELRAADSATAYAGGKAYGAGQSYLDAAPLGIGARGAWGHLPSQPARVRIVDLEQRWVLDHAELAPLAGKALVFGDNRYRGPGDDGDHGTAVLAQLASAGQRVEGIASAVAELDVVSHWDEADQSNGHVAEGIVNALVRQSLGAGDLLLLEVERSGGPTELDVADATAIQLATALGVTVIEPAGNGALDLDAQRDFEGRRVLRRGARGFRESGAVMVGAAWSTLPHDRASFSSYGSRVDCYGWGDSVLTAGYGDLDPGTAPPEAYTHTFSGTSSAAPCVAGAAAIVQALYRDRADAWLWPRRLREILADRATGTPQGPGVAGAIGVMPDLRKILAGSACGLAAQLVLRRSTADEGETCRDVTFTCPDLWLGTATDAPHDGDPAPGVSDVAATNLHVFVRVRNRGQQRAQGVGARFYAAPVATFVAPEMWQEIGETRDLATVAPGGLPVDLDGVPWPAGKPPLDPPGRAALLAIVAADFAPETLDDPLPKLRHVFDRAEYHAFLARPDVGYRNTHRVAPGDDLHCLVTGTPDRARAFDFQVLQRLPEGVRVRVTTSALLGALLRRGNPSLTTDENGNLVLPPDPCLRLDDLRLQPTACEPTTFGLTSTRGVERGHGLVVRQLHRGTEIGRVTWYFG